MKKLTVQQLLTGALLCYENSLNLIEEANIIKNLIDHIFFIKPLKRK